MDYTKTSILNLRPGNIASPLILFRPSTTDSSHIIVLRQGPDGSQGEIGHVYTHQIENETLFHCTSMDRSELFPPTTDFNEVEVHFDTYAKLLITERTLKELDSNSLQNNLTLNNLNQMKNSNQNPTNSKKVNQIIFVEYQNPTKDGHFITTSDSYRNTIGKIYRSFNTETKKFEYVAYDHAGKAISEKTEKLWELKKLFTDNSRQLLADAHTRRLEEKSKNISSENTSVNQSKKQDEKKIETEKNRQDKRSIEREPQIQPHEREEKNEITMEETEQAIRENELDQLREKEEGREDRSLER